MSLNQGISLSKLARRRTFRFFGNTLGIKLNFLYFFHHLYCRLASRHGHHGKPDLVKARELKEKGFCSLGQLDVTDLAILVDRGFERFPCINGYAALPRSENALLAPMVFEVLNSVKGPITAYFGSEFQVYWTDIQRIEPGTQGATSSYSWHVDDNPGPIMKVFIYLNDTFKDNGAFRAFDREISDQLIAKGFISNSIEARTAAQGLITEELMSRHLNVLEGRKGTVLMFDNNLVHRGTLPVKGYRNVVQIEIFPSREPLTISNVERALVNPIARDYPASPFENDMNRVIP